MAFTGRCGVDKASRVVLFEKKLRIIVENPLHISICEQMEAVVRGVDWNWNTVIFTKGFGFLEKSLGGGRRTTDGYGHYTDSTDVGLARSRNVESDVEIVQCGLRSLFRCVGDNCRPALATIAALFQSIFRNTDTCSGPECKFDGFEGKWDEIAERLCGNNSGGA